MKYTILWLSLIFFYQNILNAQNEKVVKLFNAKKYEDCIEMCDKLISKGEREHWNYLYKAMSLSMLSKNADYLKRNKLCVEQSVDILQGITKRQGGSDFLVQAQKEAFIVKQNALDIALVYANSRNEKKALNLYTDLVKIFDTPDVQMAEARMKVVMDNDANAANLLKLLDKLSAYSGQELRNWGLNEDYFKELALLVRSKNDYNVQWEILYKASIILDKPQQLNQLLFQLLQEADKVTSSDVQRAQNAFQLFADYRFIERKWELAHNVITQLTEADTLQPINNWIQAWIATDTLADVQFRNLMKLLCAEIDAKHPLQNMLVESVLYYFAQYFQIPFSESIVEQKILPYLRKENIAFGAEAESKLLAVTQLYKTYILEIDKNLKTKNYSKCMSLIREANKKYAGAERLTQLYKQTVISDYITHYKGTEISNKELAWNGSSENCLPGNTSKVAETKLKQRLQYFRRLAGVPEGIVFDEELNAKCRKAALIMYAGYMLTHYPKPETKCYTADGAQAAGSSNLSLGYHSTEALLGQMRDLGENNYSVGHRRWILYPYNRKFGHGSTNHSMALWVLPSSDSNFPPTEVEKFRQQYVAWPPEGYCPVDLIFPRWSFSLTRADFSNTVLEMWVDGKQAEVKIQPNETGIGQNTLVWEHNAQITAGSVIEIKISNVVFEYNKFNPQSYTYQVFPLKVE